MSTSQAQPADNSLARQIDELLLVGFRPERVAKKLGIPPAHVLAAKSALDAAQSPDADEQARNVLFLTLRVLREEALEAWEESKEQGEQTVIRTDSEAGKPQKVIQKTRKQSGDPRYLDRVTRLVALEARLRQIDKPAKGKEQAKVKKPGQDIYDKSVIAEERALMRYFMDHFEQFNCYKEYFQQEIIRAHAEDATLPDPRPPKTTLESRLAASPAAASPAPLPTATAPQAATAPPTATAPQPAAVHLSDDDEDQDEDAYLIERYGEDAVYLLKPSGAGHSAPTKRPIPGPAPPARGPSPPRKLDDTS